MVVLSYLEYIFLLYIPYWLCTISTYTHTSHTYIMYCYLTRKCKRIKWRKYSRDFFFHIVTETWTYEGKFSFFFLTHSTDSLFTPLLMMVIISHAQKQILSTKRQRQKFSFLSLLARQPSEAYNKWKFSFLSYVKFSLQIFLQDVRREEK